MVMVTMLDVAMTHLVSLVTDLVNFRRYHWAGDKMGAAAIFGEASSGCAASFGSSVNELVNFYATHMKRHYGRDIVLRLV